MGKLLVIDDSSFQRKWIIRSVEGLGHQIVEATDGQKGLEMVALERPDCITVDLTMPTMDGIAFLMAMRERECEIPVVVITADVQDETREQCRELGARAVVNKPFDPCTLQSVLAEFLPTSEPVE